MGNGQGFTLGHRPGLDGVRGLAILVVVLYHLHIDGFANGRVGVDMFFVMSGFLITALLAGEERRTGRVDYARFYLRRALRLFPALAVVLVVVVALSYTLDGPIASETRTAAWAAALYVANFVNITASGTDGMLWHTWSLAIEEQFYILWPLTYVVMPARWRLPATMAAFAAASALLVWAPWRGVESLPHTRGSGLLLGCAAALLLDRIGEDAARRGVGRAAVPALVLLAVAVSMPAKVLGVFPLVNVATAVLVVAATVGRAPRWLETRWLRTLGVVSYGLYLWHVPVIRVSRHWWPDLPSGGQVAIQVVASAALTWGSWRLVETPFLRLKGRAASRPVQATVAPASSRPVGAVVE